LLLQPITIAYALFKFTMVLKDCQPSASSNQICDVSSTNESESEKPNTYTFRKQTSICESFDVPTLKKAARYFNCTINDVILSLLSVSLNEFQK
jgi:hypothetical protein